MKQNNTNMLFKSLALCFLILGNLISDVLCKTAPPTPSITPTVSVTVEEKDVVVPKKDACNAINRHFKVKSKEDFFKKLVSSDATVTEYKFPSNLTGSGKDILTKMVKSAIDEAKKVNSVLTAEDAFNAFKTKVETITKAANDLKTPVTVNTTDFEMFMSNFEFDRDKFVLKNTVTFFGSTLPLNYIADNLVVYLNCSLEDLIKEIANLHVNADINNILMKTLTDAEVNLAAATTDVTAAAEKAATAAANFEKEVTDFHATVYDSSDAMDAANVAIEKAADAVIAANTAKTDAEKVKTNAQKKLNEAIDNAINDAKKQADDAVNAAVKKLIVDKLTTAPAPTSKPTSLEDLLKELSKFYIKTEYKNSASTTSPVAAVTYLIVCTGIVGDTIPLDIDIIDSGEVKKFLPKFIDTKNVLAKDVFVAISAKYAATAAINAIDHFKAILTEISSTDFAKTVKDALSTVVLEKTVLQKEFNDVFDSFNTLVPVDVEESDIGERKITLCWLSNVADLGKQFNNYITWLESKKKLIEATFNTKEEAVNAFFKVLQDSLTEYKTKLERDLKSAEVTPEEKKKPDGKETKGKNLEEKPDGKEAKGKNLEEKPDGKEAKGKNLEEKPDKKGNEKLIGKRDKTEKEKNTERKKTNNNKIEKNNAAKETKTGMSTITKTIIIIGGAVLVVLVISGAGIFTWYYYFKEKV